MASIDLWTIDTAAWCAARSHLEHLLSRDEIARSRQFRTALLTARYVARTAAARCVLAQYGDDAPQDLRLTRGKWGKPFLDGPGTPLFNVSHAVETTVVAVSTDPGVGALGVDAEAPRPDDLCGAVARACYSPDEQALLASCPVQHRQTLFLRLWTAKEAVVKASGRGLTIPLQSFFLAQRDNGDLYVAGGGWRGAAAYALCPVTAAPDVVCTVAARAAGPPDVRCRSASTLLADAVDLPPHCREAIPGP